MADTVAHAKVVYTGDDKNFQRASKNVNKSVAENVKKFRNMALVITGATVAMAALVKKALSAAESISDMANKANSGVEALQELRFAASQNGATTRDMDDALTRLTRRMSLFAMDGGGPAAKAIEALNLQILDTEGNLRKSDEVFLELAERFGDFKTDAEAAAIASQLFGEDAGPRLVPLLRQGAAGLAEFTTKAREMGIVLDEAGVRKAAQANAKLRALSESMAGNFNRAIIDNIENIEALIPLLEDAASGIGTITGAAMTGAGELIKYANAAFFLAQGASAMLAETAKGIVGGPVNQIIDPPLPGEDGEGSDGGGQFGPVYDPEYAEKEAARREALTKARNEAAHKEYAILRQMQIDFFGETETAEKAHGGRMAAIKEESQKEQITTFGGFLDVMASKSVGGHQKMFKALAAIAGKEGLINTYRAASQALADPLLPFWAKAAAVGSVLAQGLSLVSSIQSVGGVSAGGAAASPAGGAVAPASSASGGGDGQYLNLNLVGDMFGRDAIVGLISQLNEAVEDGAIIKGVRAT